MVGKFTLHKGHLMEQEIAVIVGAGKGLSASLARKFSSVGMKVVLAARNIEKLDPLVMETAGLPFACNASDPDSVKELFAHIKKELGIPSVVIFNARKYY